MSPYIVLGVLASPIAIIFLYMIYRDIYVPLRAGHLRVYIVDAAREIRRINVKLQTLEDTGEVFRYGKETYSVQPDQVYRMGLFRIPTAVYIEGCMEPVDLLKLRLESKISSAEFHEAIETHVATDIMSSFKKPMMAPEMTMGIMLFIILGGLGYIYYEFSQTLAEISRAVGVQ